MAKASAAVVTASAGITSERARVSRARAWAFVFDCYGKKKAAEGDRPDGRDAKELKNGCAAQLKYNG